MGENKQADISSQMARARKWRNTWGSAMYSRHSPHAKLLENPHAIAVLETIYQAIPADTHAGPVNDDLVNTSLEICEYQAWVHDHLKRSGLAVGLAGGPDYLPDITSTLPQPWRLLSRLFAPRNYVQLTRHVLKNLAWYLDQEQQPRTPFHKLREVFLISLILTAMLTLCLTFVTQLVSASWPVLVLVACAIELLILTVAMSVSHDSEKHKTNCAELYAYLLESYAEPGEGDENQAKSLLRELGRDPDPSRQALLDRANRN